MPTPNDLQQARLILVILVLHNLDNDFANLIMIVVLPLFSLFHHLPLKKHNLDVSK